MGFLAIVWVATGSPAGAQVFDASDIQKPVYVDAAWRVQAGDNPAWAKADFDDSKWLLVDPYKSLVEYLPDERPEVVWYRIRLKVSSRQSGLALEVEHLSHAFEIYVNGDRLLRAGSVAPYHPYTDSARRIAAFDWADMETGTLVLALRVHISRGEWSSALPGLYYDNLMVGRRPQLQDYLWLAWISSFAGYALIVVLGLITGIMALGLYWVQRDRTEYLWMAVVALGYLVDLVWSALLRVQNLPLEWATCLDGVLLLWVLLGPVFMYLAFLRIRMPRRVAVALLVAAGLSLIQVVGRDYEWMRPGLRIALSVPLYAAAYFALPIVLLVHWRRGNREAGILLIPALLQALEANLQLFFDAMGAVPRYSTWAYNLGVAWTSYRLGPFNVQLTHISNGLFWISLALILVLRTIRISREQARMEHDLEAARQVQSVILPPAQDVVPGFTVETVYRPAQQVGGDFFQVWPAPDGGLLLVLGDVAGKGLPAAMMVAVLVGSIRTLAQVTSDPAEILAHMNERMQGRTGGGFSTCLALYLHTDGTGLLASAGHPAPYMNGCEVDVEGALPLGIAPGVEYASQAVYLDGGARLTFYSDGVLEAQNARGELLGFERVQQLSRLSAKEIADAASAFGQNDDITVVVIERAKARTEGAAARPEHISLVAAGQR
ncbi:MAG TPA: PP2C family protein-serine/threonine phosphatase [Terracidiphilus sp.]